MTKEHINGVINLSACPTVAAAVTPPISTTSSSVTSSTVTATLRPPPSTSPPAVTPPASPYSVQQQHHQPHQQYDEQVSFDFWLLFFLQCFWSFETDLGIITNSSDLIWLWILLLFYFLKYIWSFELVYRSLCSKLPKKCKIITKNSEMVKITIDRSKCKIVDIKIQ